MKKVTNSSSERSFDDKVYDALEGLENIATKLVKLNKFLKNERKKSKKKDKKLYKLNKKTGALVMRQAKRQKSAKLHKRFGASEM